MDTLQGGNDAPHLDRAARRRARLRARGQRTHREHATARRRDGAAATVAEAAAAVEPSALPRPPGLACAPVKVHFALDSAQLYDSEKPILDTAARCLRDNDKQRVTIVGNADERGPAAYNEDLGQRRANTVARISRPRRAAPAQVEAVISHGEDSPLCRESTLRVLAAQPPHRGAARAATCERAQNM